MLPTRPEDCALLLIDQQVGTMQLIRNIDRNLAAAQAVTLAEMASILGIPTIITSSQEDHAQGPIMLEIAAILPDTFAARVRRGGVVTAWPYSDFRQAVEATGRRTLLMADVTTDVWLIFPAIDAANEGYRVQAIIDASGSPSELSEMMSRERMEAAGVVLTATNTLIAELAQNWSSQRGTALIQLLFSDVFPALGAGIET